jgi:hypothetical protein
VIMAGVEVTPKFIRRSIGKPFHHKGYSKVLYLTE